MYFIDRRIKTICDDLKKLSVVQKQSIENWKFKPGYYVRPSEADSCTETPYQDFYSSSSYWSGADTHYWFTGTIKVPENFDNKPLWLSVYTQMHEMDEKKNPQFLLFVNGEATQGIDMNHMEVLISPNAKSGEEYRIDLQGYTGILNANFNLYVDILEIDHEIEMLYYDLRVPLDAFVQLSDDERTRVKLEKVMNEGINLLDLRIPYSNEFYASVTAAREYLDKHLYQDLAGNDEAIASCIGHTHIDVAYLWTVAQTREKVSRSFSTVLKLMEEYPNYKFMSSQPQLYVFLKERYPELYEKVKERIKEQRWEPEGGMWLEADCNLTSGESLVRQFVHGKKFFKEEFGIDNRVLWLPDVFGYSGALPQIMDKSGIDYFMTTKLAWNQINQFPADTFKWKGIDGTEILTHLITTTELQQPKGSFYTTYNGKLHSHCIIGGWKRYQDYQINNDYLVCYGFGDGGGGPTRDMLETSKRLEKGLVGIPKVRQVFSHQYFKELDERVKDNPRLKTWEGELYFEYHRGTYTSLARNKRYNRKLEIALMDLELFSILAENTLDYPTQELDSIWKIVMLNQFHDILPGSTIEEVTKVTLKEYEQVTSEANELKSARVNALMTENDGLTIFNTTAFENGRIVNLGDIKADAIVDNAGKTYPVQQTATGALAYVDSLPSKGYKSFSITDKKENQTVFTVKDMSIETPFYNVQFTDNGLISSIFDKENSREIVQENAFANLMTMYEDKPARYDNWDIDMYYTEKSWDVTDLESFEWISIGEVCATAEIKRKISNSTISQKISFYAQSKRIDFETIVDWKEHQHLLKAHFPVDVHTDYATFDIQFGNLTRKTHTNTSWDEARFETCGQKWVDLSEGHYGVSLLNDCKYGHSISNSNIGLTLVKSGIHPNPNTDNEIHNFTYSLFPHSGNWRDGGTVAQAYILNQETTCIAGKASTDEFSLASVNKNNVVMETIKKAEDGNGIIVRLYECDNSKTTATVTWNMPFNNIDECDLLENKIADVDINANEFSFQIKPYEIKTFRIY